MRQPDLQVEQAKRKVMELFEDKYYRPKKTPYYTSQIQTLLEGTHYQWVTYKAINQLVKENKLAQTTIATKYAQRVNVLYNAKLAKPESNHSLDIHIKSIGKLIDRYSDPNVCKKYGEHLEQLVKNELELNGFRIIAEHTNRYGEKEYTKTNHNLDFIADHLSGKLKLGIEVKNTLSIMGKNELDAKLDMCDVLGVKPLFAVRWLKPYMNYIQSRDGFCWIFKTQIYPPGFEKLTKMLWKRLGLPVNVRSELPEKSTVIFRNWVKRQLTINNP